MENFLIDYIHVQHYGRCILPCRPFDAALRPRSGVSTMGYPIIYGGIALTGHRPLCSVCCVSADSIVLVNTTPLRATLFDFFNIGKHLDQGIKGSA
eukprot:6195485-Pleurochrysis_carterae.AAC.3